ncbi:MAG TPA: hypothetical protein VHC22_01525 [Pirellulales bacterium]|nr:hypothetical protein [Pirellulales bacterium]
MKRNTVHWLTDSLSKLVGRISFAGRSSAAQPTRRLASLTILWSADGNTIEESPGRDSGTDRSGRRPHPARLFDDRLRMRIMQAFRQHEHKVACRGGDFYFFGMLAEVEKSWRAKQGAAQHRVPRGTSRFTDPTVDRFFVCPDYEMLEFLDTCFATRAMRSNSSAAEAAQTINRCLEEAIIGAALRQLDRR